MLNQTQLQDWFLIQGIDCGISFPIPLMKRLISKAYAYDTTLFAFLGSSYVVLSETLLLLKFKTWEEAFAHYQSLTTKVA